VQGDVDVDALQIVLTGTADLDKVARHELDRIAYATTAAARETRHYRRIRGRVHLSGEKIPRASDVETTIAGYPAAVTSMHLPSLTVRLYAVPDLERLVDRGALLRGESEPPYWAYLWTGARCLAEYVARWVDVRARRVLDIGCGLGLVGIVAAHRGARVTYVDAALPALHFVRASLRANDVTAPIVCTDYRTLAAGARFDVIVAAEVAYEPPRFPDLAATLARHLAPGGVVLLADAFRTDTRALYGALAREQLTTRAIELYAREEGRPARLRIRVARRGTAPPRPHHHP
jgi:predicted nicotinamide N-methyase